MADKDRISEQETARRRDKVLLRMLKTPPKTHSAMKASGKPKKSSEMKKPAK